MPDVIIQRIHTEADGVVSLDLVAVDGGLLPAFEAGAHIDVHLPGGLIRQYSLCSDPAQQRVYTIAVWRDPQSRGGSQAVHEQLQPGQRLQISEPRNLFPLVSTEGRALLLAGGIGITPILAMATTLAARQQAFELHYCFRDAATAAYTGCLQQGALAAACHLHDSSHGSRMNAGQVLANPAANDHLYVCGSAGFIEQMLATATAQGWQSAQLHREYFDAPETATEAAADSFEIRVGERSFTVAASQTVAEVLEANGLPVAVSCGKGICGSCLTTVLEGEPDHRDLYLTEEEQAANDQFTPCCSRARSPYLVLELS